MHNWHMGLVHVAMALNLNSNLIPSRAIGHAWEGCMHNWHMCLVHVAMALNLNSNLIPTQAVQDYDEMGAAQGVPRSSLTLARNPMRGTPNVGGRPYS